MLPFFLSSIKKRSLLSSPPPMHNRCPLITLINSVLTGRQCPASVHCTHNSQLPLAQRRYSIKNGALNPFTLLQLMLEQRFIVRQSVGRSLQPDLTLACTFVFSACIVLRAILSSSPSLFLSVLFLVTFLFQRQTVAHIRLHFDEICLSQLRKEKSAKNNAKGLDRTSFFPSEEISVKY